MPLWTTVQFTPTGGVTPRTIVEWGSYIDRLFGGGDPGPANFEIDPSPLAQNRWKAVGSVSGISPSFVTVGVDTNLSGAFAAKGTGSLVFGNGSGTQGEFEDSGAGSLNWLAFSGSAGAYGRIKAKGAGAAIGVAIIPKGTGAITAAEPDSLAAGGNARGTNATDLQTSRTGAAQVASGVQSAIVGGTGNTATGEAGFAGGRFSNATGYASFAYGNLVTASGFYGVAQGNQSSDRGAQGKIVYSSAPIGSTLGSSQTGKQTLCQTTTSATPAVLTANGAALTTANSMPMPNNSVMRFAIHVVAYNKANGDSACWDVRALVRRGSSQAAMSLVGSAGTAAAEFAAAGASAWAIALAVDTTFGCPKITVTGVAATTIYWHATVYSAEVMPP